MADAYLKVKDNGANGLELVRDSSEISVIKRSLAKYAKADLIDLYYNQNKVDTTSQTVTFTWNDDKTECTVVGTCPSDAVDNAYCIFARVSGFREMPEGFESGKTYHAKITSTGNEVLLKVFGYINGTYSRTIISIASPRELDFTIPGDMESVLVCIAVNRGSTASETVTEATICEV